MSQLARMFVVLNFLLAAGFLYAAAMFLGLNHEYKKKNEALTIADCAQATVKRRSARRTQKTRIDDLTRESQTLKEDAAEPTGRATAPAREARTTTAEKDKKEKDAAIAKEQGNVASAEREPEARDRRAREAHRRGQQARTDAATAQAAERKANDELEKAKTEIRNRDNTIAELEKTKTEMTGKIDELEIVKKIAQDAGVDLTHVLRSAPIADAKVIGVRHGHEARSGQRRAPRRRSLAARRSTSCAASSYIGRIKIDQVYPNSAAGTLVIAAPGQTVQVGDRATNTIN